MFPQAVAGFYGAAFGQGFGVGFVAGEDIERAQVRVAFAVGDGLKDFFRIGESLGVVIFPAGRLAAGLSFRLGRATWFQITMRTINWKAEGNCRGC